MLQSLWYQLCIIICVYWFGTEMIWNYEQVEPIVGLSKGEWFAGALGGFALIGGSAYWYVRRAGKGMVKETGLEKENGPVIPLACVEKIVWEGWGFPAMVLLADDKVKMHLQDKDFIKLAATRLNKWTIDDDEVTVASGEAGQDLQISYAPLGMYGNFFDIGKWLIVFLLMLKFSSEMFGGDTKLLFRASLICILPFCILLYYRRIKVSVEGDKVLLKRGKKEESFRFGDVAGIEKGLFQVKVTAKDGKVFFFPRGCILLPEIIEEFAGLAGR
ncbi:hypothetical protein [Anaeroselena agilis]|uniref:DUF304 domain-containing protein n=1 Tax=Anaeroselena agilis TaxID=3063788 RepID=A0ABU3NVI4_9FIRM|nr:hypothetical protein [Selenomonadales bacterium 4137-cl]